MEQTDITARLRRLANDLLDAYERIEAPSTYLEAERAAKALIAIGKAVSMSSDEPVPVKPVEVKAASTHKTAVPSQALTLERAAKALMRGDFETFETLMPPAPPV
jgi:hypothetical protein